MKQFEDFPITRFLNSIRWVLVVIFLAFLLMSFLHGALLYTALEKLEGIPDGLRVGGAIVGGLVLASFMLTASIFKRYLSWSTGGDADAGKKWQPMPYVLAVLEATALGRLLWASPFEALLLSFALGLGLTVIAFIFEKLSNPIMQLYGIQQHIDQAEQTKSDLDQQLSDLEQRRATAEQRQSEADQQLSEFRANYGLLIRDCMERLTCPACGARINSNTQAGWNAHSPHCGNADLLAELREWAKTSELEEKPT